jgi:hypothetical protein
MDNLANKLKNFKNALQRLKEAAQEFNRSDASGVVRDGLMQRFDSLTNWPGKPPGNTWRISVFLTRILQSCNQRSLRQKIITTKGTGCS